MPPKRTGSVMLGQTRRGMGSATDAFVMGECGGLWMVLADGDVAWHSAEAVKERWPLVTGHEPLVTDASADT
jgi:hypothetical protein